MTGKNIRQRYKTGRRTHLVLRQRSFNFKNIGCALKTVEHNQRYDRAVRNCENIRLRECFAEQQSNREGMRPGWRTPVLRGLKFLSVSGPHISSLPRTRRNLRNLARFSPAPADV